MADDDNDEDLVFAGQVSRAETQVTGLTNEEQAKDMMTLSTAHVQTKPDNHSKPSPYAPSTDLFKFSNPERSKDDVAIANNQVYKGQPLSADDDDPMNPQPVQTMASNAIVSKQPTFNKPTAARQHGRISGLHAKHFMLKGRENSTVAFGKFQHRSSCIMLALSGLLAVLFLYSAISLFSSFSTPCENQACISSEITDQDVIDGIEYHELTIIDGCSHNAMWFASKDGKIREDTTFTKIQNKELDINTMFISSSSHGTEKGFINSCTNHIIANDKDINGYVYLEYDDYAWDFPAAGFYILISIFMAGFFVMIEWCFYSYNEIMVPYKDYRAYIFWYIIRMGWMSFMFTIVIAQSFLVIEDDVTYLIGRFGYIWLEIDCYMATAMVCIVVLICLCCCCFQESDGWASTTFHHPFQSQEDFGCERFFLPQSRIELELINDFEQGLGSAMCVSMLFVGAFIICGIIPFIQFVQGGFGGYMYIPYVAMIFFLAIIVMTFQMCWFVRARCCGDDEDKEAAAIHSINVQATRASRGASMQTR